MRMCNSCWHACMRTEGGILRAREAAFCMRTGGSILHVDGRQHFGYKFEVCAMPDDAKDLRAVDEPAHNAQAVKDSCLYTVGMKCAAVREQVPSPAPNYWSSITSKQAPCPAGKQASASTSNDSPACKWQAEICAKQDKGACSNQ